MAKLPSIALRRLRLLIVACSVLLGLAPALCAAAEIALTFDDGLNPSETPQAAEWNARLLSNLRREGVTAMIFPSLKHTGGEAGKALVAQWGEAGHAVGNHTSRHRSLGSTKLSLDDFIDDVRAADAAFGDLPGWTRRLRFPYLKEGDTAAKRDGLRAWMQRHGYASAPVSIDTSDWYYNEGYLALAAQPDADRRLALRGHYVQHIVDRARCYDALAQRVLGRSPRHVLLMHVNAINAQWLPEVLQALRQDGWHVVSPAQAYADPLYAAKPDVLPAGESIVWSLAKQAGVLDLRYPAEDARYEESGLRSAGLLR